MPPERKTPKGTSETKRESTASPRRSSSSWALTVSSDRVRRTGSGGGTSQYLRTLSSPSPKVRECPGGSFFISLKMLAGQGTYSRVRYLTRESGSICLETRG